MVGKSQQLKKFKTVMIPKPVYTLTIYLNEERLIISTRKECEWRINLTKEIFNGYYTNKSIYKKLNNQRYSIQNI